MLETMTRVQVIGLHAQLEATLATIGRLGVLHLADATKNSALKSLALDPQRVRLQEDLSFLGARLDALIQLLPAVDEQPAANTQPLPDRAQELAAYIRRELDQIAPSLQALAQKRDDLEAEALALPRYEAMLHKLLPLAAELRVPPGFDTLALYIDKRYRDALDLLRVEVEHVTNNQSQVVSADVDERTIAALVVFPHAAAAPVHEVLEHENITQVRLPREIAGRSFHDARRALEERQHRLQQEIAAIDAKLEQQARAWRSQLSVWRIAVTGRLQGLQAETQFASTAQTFVMEGWLPRRALARVREELARAVGNTVLVHELPVDEHDAEHAPVTLDNKPVLKPFERLVRTMGIPHAGGFDPTWLLAIFLPLFFGIIVGDIGYGALLLIAALLIKRRYGKKNKAMRDLSQLLVYGSTWAMIWGVLYGEIFGTLQYTLGTPDNPWPPAIWIPRTGEQIVTLFVFSLAVGAAHVVLGLLLGVWEAWREKHTKEVVGKIGMLVALSALFGMVGALTNLLPAAFFTPTIVALIIGIVLLIVPLGWMGVLIGPLELVETIGNIMSYLRLAAVGLASVYIALVANEMVGVFGNVVLGVIVALLLHALNFAILMLSPSIQVLRLHYVEFFRQFYKTGGQEYRPFKVEA
jgi:V/A-type H+/Na+-transporting ATPase subunit I